ncbi:MAG: hypothetical protein PHE20_03955 [Patescibacteria group bacterium]|nr:hypothetical protein [Patescibacteria group bacterium]
MFKFETLNPLNKIRDSVNKTVNESRLPSEDYESSVGVYGGKLRMMEGDNKMVWDNSGVVSKIDRFGDAVLRNYDEHLVRNVGEILKRDPKLFFKFIMPGAKRFRGNKEEILNNIKRLGLEGVYGDNEKGIEIKDQSLYRDGLALQDIMRSDIIDSDKLNRVDRFQALESAGAYLHQIHDQHGAVGEVLPSDFIFKQDEAGEIKETVLNLPDIIFNPDKNIGEREQKATDMLDFIISSGAEEFRRSEGDLAIVKKAMGSILNAYGDKYVIALVKSYLKRGRLTLMGDQQFADAGLDSDSFTTKARTIFTKHNEARMGSSDKNMETSLKKVALELCDEIA